MSDPLLLATASSLRSKVAAECRRLHESLRAACESQRVIDESVSALEGVERALAAQQQQHQHQQGEPIT
jgi:hypothetical protein